MVLNQGKYKFKVSELARLLNWFIIINIITMLSQAVIMSQVFNRNWMSKNSALHQYIFPDFE
jgi:hypothetical protein